MKKKNSKNKKHINYFLSHYTLIAFATALVLYLFAFTHYDIVDINNSISYDAVISNVEYGSDRASAWAKFDASGMPVYYVFESRKAAKTGGLEKIEELAENKTDVRITLTDYKSWLRAFDFTGRKQVVDIRTEDEVVFDADIYNNAAKTKIILWSVIATILLVSAAANVIIRIKFKI